MSPPPRLLFVSEKFPWPVDDGGQTRTYQLLRALARSLPVTLLAHAPPTPADEGPIRELGVEVVTFPRSRPAWKQPWWAAQALFTRRPYPLPKNHSRGIRDELVRRIARGEARALHLNHLDAAQYLDELGPLRGRVTTLFDTHNLLTTLYRRLVDTAADPLRKSYCWVQWTRMARYEPRMMHAADRVAVCSEPEREQLRVWGVDRALLVPNGVDAAYFTPGEARAEELPARANGANGTAPPLELVFTGAMGYLPNSEGVAWFVDEVLPRIERERAPVRLSVVGKDPPASLAARARPGRVELTGRVADVRPRARLAQVFVVPLRIGGGTRLKILEALAMGLPVVSTRVGAEGLDLRDGTDLLLADEPEAFAAAVLALGRDPARARALAESGRARVLERYDWSAVAQPLVEWYAERS